MRCKTFHRKKIVLVFAICLLLMLVLVGRLVHLMIFESEYYQELAQDLHERERGVKAARGQILDRNGAVLADNESVCTISVIHSQIEDPEGVIAMLVRELGISEEEARTRVEKVSSIERIKSNVDIEIGDAIRAYGYAGVKVDEDYKRYYPYGELASKVLGFTGSDNQGIIGLEVKYDEYLEGIPGTILTLTDARGIEIENAKEERVESVPGNNLLLSLDYSIQAYAQQEAMKL
ncbi:MAG: peptidoglycan glycosyltransferase, partial [Lachnospiraceae bacterium]|nr:peptidoglycan glycosyltransferase [Lachnospiraceae bacterium]